MADERVRFRRVGEDEVELGGTLDATGATDITAFTLPLGFRPTKEEQFVLSAPGGQQTVVTIAPNGDVIGEPGAGLIELNGIVFKTSDPRPPGY